MIHFHQILFQIVLKIKETPSNSDSNSGSDDNTPTPSESTNSGGESDAINSNNQNAQLQNALVGSSNNNVASQASSNVGNTKIVIMLNNQVLRMIQKHMKLIKMLINKLMLILLFMV